MQHTSVLLNESIEMLQIKDDGIYVDCTLGRGGHSSEILKRLKSGHLYAFDCDSQAIKDSEARLKKIGDNFTLVHTAFQNLSRVLDKYGIDKVDGILMDLGVSSPQFDDQSRGFSYRYDARLDMRMDQSQPLDAYHVVNEYSVEELAEVFRKYGEEPFAWKIANQIEKDRKDKPIETTFELVGSIKKALPQKVLNKKGHPAKKCFQAIRIEVNHELQQLEIVLSEGLERLNSGGVMAVITFHSLEDRIVKDAFKKVATPPKVDKRLPQLREENLEYRLMNRKPILASKEELENNNRAHSAKLRGIQKL